jgi:hypothetical protein
VEIARAARDDARVTVALLQAAGRVTAAADGVRLGEATRFVERLAEPALATMRSGEREEVERELDQALRARADMAPFTQARR